MTGRIGILPSAIEIGFEALSRTESDDPHREDLGHRVMDGLRSLYELTGDPSALERGIALARAELERDPAPDSSWRLALAMMLSMRATDLEEATEILRGYLAAIPADHREHARATSTLGLLLTSLYRQTGALAFLQEAIALFRTCAADASSGTRNSLGQSLHALYRRTGDPAALAEAVQLARDLVSSIPMDYPYRSVYLSNLADYLDEQWQLTGDTALLAQSAEVNRAAVVAAGNNLAHRAIALSRLTHVLLALAREDGDAGLIAAAVGAARQAVRFSDGAHLNRAAHMLALGSALIRQGVTSGDMTALTEAQDVLSRAAALSGASVDDRITASQQWATAAMHLNDPHEAEGAYRHAVNLMAERAGPALAWADREHGIHEASALPGDAAAAAVAAGHPDTAVALLEQSRGILLAEALHTQIDVGALAKHSPQLAEDFRRVSSELRAVDMPQQDVGGPMPTWMAQRRLDLDREWLRFCERLRKVPGFEDFLLPPTLPAVRDATDGGPVVIVNVSTWRCDALLVTGADVKPLPLPDLSTADCVTRANQYLNAFQDYQDAVQALVCAREEAEKGADAAAYQRYHAAKVAVRAARSAVEETLTVILAWLWDVVAGPVVEHLHLDLASMRRLWWCPTGPLALLPLHAAGHLGDPERSLPDRAVSSYAPTLRALVKAHRSHDADPDPRMLVVAMPRTPGQVALPNAARERDHLRLLFPAPSSTVLSDAAATRDNVVDALASHRWIHFSCHGEQVMDAPADSCLLLADGPLTITRLIAEKPSGEFAFLSACKTAAGGVTLLNETITLASALHYAGYRHVIATLWSVLDAVAADLAAATYDALTVTGQFRPADAARALHSAVRQLRAEYPGQPSVWAPFVHIGV